jgi:hypothetical protein
MRRGRSRLVVDGGLTAHVSHKSIADAIAPAAAAVAQE